MGTDGHSVAGNDASTEAVMPLMTAMAQGSADALFELIDRFGNELERVVRGILSSLHRRDIARSSDHVASLVVSAGFVLFSRASGWNPDGSLPWVWAYRSIRAEIVKDVGHPTFEFDPALGEAVTPDVRNTADHAIDLEALATHHDGVAAWISALDDVASDRDRGVHLEYQVQKRLGDPSPAVTVATMFDLRPANVRQIDRRVRMKLEQSPHATPELVRAMSSGA